MTHLLQQLGLAFKQIGKGIKKALIYFFRGLWFFLRPIFKPKGRNKIRVALIFIFLIALATGLTDYPFAWDKAVDWLNPRLDKVGFLSWINLPHWHNWPYQLGLDLQGGTHLVYEADTSQIKPENISDAMQGVRDVIERRVNLFGVKEPLIQIEKQGGQHRLIVELAGIQNTSQAIQMIGLTPSLDFREERDEAESQEILEAQQQGERLWEDARFKPTGLTGQHLERAQLIFDQNTSEPKISLEFNDEGKKLFADITERNVDKIVAIYLDQMPISLPRVNEAIPSGRAEISGSFTVEEAQTLARRLNAGALPVPIQLISQQTVGPSLGKISLDKSLHAGLIGFLLVILFMIFYYRLPGLLAGIALLIYASLVLTLFKLVPVTLTLSGIAGFILSLGMAVDANVLIFERQKEELRQGRNLTESIKQGFGRAWPSIRDGNFSTLLTCLILYSAATGMIKGFALTLGIGILVSMFSAMIITKTLLKWFVGTKLEKFKWIFNTRKP